MLLRSDLRGQNVENIIYLTIIFRPNPMFIVVIIMKKSAQPFDVN